MLAQSIPPAVPPHGEKRGIRGSVLRDLILGWQDGLVNVLGLILGIATATNSVKLVLISGLAAAFAETLAMAAVAYTSSKAAHDFYIRELKREMREVEEIPEVERQEIRGIYYNKGFRGDELEMIVKRLTADKKLWVETMMAEELRLFPEQYEHPLRSASTVGVSAVTGSFIPLIPFFFLPVFPGVYMSVAISVAVLFGTGAVKARLTIGDWRKSGLEMAAVGTGAAAVGYIIGVLLGGSSISG